MTFTTSQDRARASAPTFQGSIDEWSASDHYKFRRIMRQSDSVDQAKQLTGLTDGEIRTYLKVLEIPLDLNSSIITAHRRKYEDQRKNFNNGAGELLLMERIEGNWDFEKRQKFKTAHKIKHHEPEPEISLKKLPDKKRIHSSTVIRNVELFLNMPKGTVVSKGRTRKQIAAKRLAVHALKAICPHLSYPQIGKAMGGYDHSTILNHYQNPCAELKSFLEALEKK